MNFEEVLCPLLYQKPYQKDQLNSVFKIKLALKSILKDRVNIVRNPISGVGRRGYLVTMVTGRLPEKFRFFGNRW